MKCEKCGVETALPFKCRYCGKYFCADHRLPENHGCTRIELARQPTAEVQTAPQSYEYTISYPSTRRARGWLNFSRREIRDLAIAAILVIGVGLSMIALPSLFSGSSIDYALIALFGFTFTASFFVHEFAHKIVAQRGGLWAEFRLTLVGAALTFISIISPFFKVISPGAVMVAGYADKEKTGKISIAGPITNIALAVGFLVLALVFPSVWILALAALFNSWIALFNLIPFGIFDGFKVFSWNKAIWAGAFVISIAIMLVSYQQYAGIF